MTRSRTPGLARNTLTSYGRFALTVALFLVLTPYVVDRLGTETYGLWTLALSTVGFFGVLDLGFGTAVVRFVGESRGLGAVRRRNEVLSTILATYCVLAIVAAVALAVLAAHFATWFALSDEMAGPAELVIWIVGLRSVVLALPLSVFRGALFGSERIQEVNAIQIGSVLFYGAGVWVALEAGAGISGLALANLAAMLVEHCAYVVVAYRLLPDLRLRPSLVRSARLREVGSFSLYSLVGLLAGVVLLRADPLIVNMAFPLSAVAVYGIALKVAEYGLVLTKQLANVLTPYFARVGAEGDVAQLRFVFERASRFALLPPALALVSAAFLGDRALQIWLGEEFQGGGIVLTILAGATLVSAPQLVASSLLSMTGHHRFTALAAAVAVPTNVGLSVLLVGPLGLAGVALGTLGTTLLVDAFFVVPRALRVQGLVGGPYLSSLFRAVAIPMALQSGVLLAATRTGLTGSIGGLITAGGLSALAFAAVAWRTALTPRERRAVVERLRRWASDGRGARLEGAET